MIQLQRYLAELYVSSECYSKALSSLIDTTVEVNKALFASIKQRGIDIYFTANDPYPDLESLSWDIKNNNKMLVYSEGSCPDYLTEKENLESRAVHDYYGHFTKQYPFNFKGELDSYFYQRRFYPKHCWPFLFSEIVIQSAYTSEFADFPEQQKFVLCNKSIADFNSKKEN